MFPVMLDLTGRLAVVVGGGTVGRRKVAALRAAGARVRVVCLEERPPDEPAVEWIRERYQAVHLDGAAIVFAAAPAEVNREVVRDARSRGIWAMDAAEPTAGDFHTPAVLRRGGLVVAVSTSGASPLLAARIRDRLDATLEPEVAAWVALLAELRPEVLALEPGRRRAVFERLCEDAWLERLRGEGVDAVRAAMRGEIGILS
jgi:precorrin-2 dehydrogenase/sirohydrochlorin ferrochelatase